MCGSAVVSSAANSWNTFLPDIDVSRYERHCFPDLEAQLGWQIAETIPGCGLVRISVWWHVVWGGARRVLVSVETVSL